MDAKLQRRVQRYGWDLASVHYEALWRRQIVGAQVKLLQCALLSPGERVLDVACGTGIVAFAASRAVGPDGHVTGIDLSGQMVETARLRGDVRRVANASFARMDAERLELPAGSFDVALCALGLMYMPRPEQALREMRRVLRPGGRLAVAVWGDQMMNGWSALFPIVDAEVQSDVCPLFFRLGHGDTLASACREAGFASVKSHRVPATLGYADPDEVCNAAFVGGPVALAWSRFDEVARASAFAVATSTPWARGGRAMVIGYRASSSSSAPGLQDRNNSTENTHEGSHQGSWRRRLWSWLPLARPRPCRTFRQYWCRRESGSWSASVRRACRSTSAAPAPAVPAPAWAFVAPEADLFDAQGRKIGTHYAGPHWEAADGSKIVGAVKTRAEAPQAGAIPWLLLTTKSVGAQGRFAGVTSVQRVNTSGGTTPTSPCDPTRLGTQARVVYAADYVLLARG